MNAMGTIGGNTARRKRFSLASLRAHIIKLLFVLGFLLPSTLAAIYYGFLATDIYVSETKFIVRGVTGQSVGGFASLFRTLGISKAEDDAFAIQNFIRSRDAVRAIDADLGLRQLFSHQSIDQITRLGGIFPDGDFEALYQYYLRRVDVVHNDVTGITTLKVQAFKPKDAEAISRRLLGLSEGLVNRMNSRANDDSQKTATKILAAAEAAVVDAQRRLTAFRNKESFVDPTSQSVKAFDLIGRLSGELAQTRIQLRELSVNAPTSPAVEGLESRVSALQRQISEESAKIVGSDQALAAKMAEYERLVLQREFADRALSLAFDSLEATRQDARRKQLYIQTIVVPNLPDAATEPRRFRYFFTVLLFSFTLFGMVWLIVSGSMEHAHG